MKLDEDLLEKRLLPQVEKPAQYRGGELHSVVKEWDNTPARMVFAFPDLYEIGMSHLGLRILYEAINNHSPHLCERVFMPADDMAALLREQGLPLCSLESRHSLRDFDLVGFTLQYELSYTNILAMLDLAGIPPLAASRDEDMPLIAAGGPCAYNPEPLADFIDLFFIGEGENLDRELLDMIAAGKEIGWSKQELLSHAALLPGVYVPRFYQPTYDQQGRYTGLIASEDAPAGLPLRIRKQALPDLDSAIFPEQPLLPLTQPVHDRVMLEVMRGCGRGCRFCQAGMIYRPIREKRPDTLLSQARTQLSATGYDDVALLSLSSADYSGVEGLMGCLLAEHKSAGVSVSLPSLRVDAFSVSLAARTQELRKSGITLAPEAGSQRLRDVINKGVTEEDILSAATAAFAQGYTHIKLYFMLGLPYESDSDIAAIAELCKKILRLGRENKPAEVKKPLRLSLGVASFVPKCDTPFQWQPQNSMEELKRKQDFLRDQIKPLRAVTVNFHDRQGSRLEAAFARGDRRLGQVLYRAWRNGCHLDGWKEFFRPDLWQQAFDDQALDADAIARWQPVYGQALPWSHIDCGVREEWLWQENLRAGRSELTTDCRQGVCNNCGICDGELANVIQTPLSSAWRSVAAPLPTERVSRWRCRMEISGAYIWVSHLDLLAAMEKTLRRSNLPMAYSQGFNPHMLISWGPAHPVGVGGDHEYTDLTFAADPSQVLAGRYHAASPGGVLAERFNLAAPPGLRMLDAVPLPENAKACMAQLVFAEYRLRPQAAVDWTEFEQRCLELRQADQLPTERLVPPSRKIVDLRPALAYVYREEENIIYGLWLNRGAAARPAEITALLLPGQKPAAATRTLLAAEPERKVW